MSIADALEHRVQAIEFCVGNGSGFMDHPGFSCAIQAEFLSKSISAYCRAAPSQSICVLLVCLDLLQRDADL
jgi:hypothetical protein